MIHFIKQGKIFLFISIIIIALSTYFINIQPTKYSVEFSGGTIIKTNKKSNTSELIKIHPSASITQQKEYIEITIPGVKLIKKDIERIIEIESINYIGPSISQDLVSGAIWAVNMSLIATLLYISFRFEWYFGICTILTLIHNLYITYGFICFKMIAIDSHVIAAILFVTGYSINDSIVIFDRIRENIKKNPNIDYATNAHNSIMQTLNRTIYTVVTTLIAPVVISILGHNDVLEYIGLISIVGIIAGAYASITLSAYILYSLHKIKLMIQS